MYNSISPGHIDSPRSPATPSDTFQNFLLFYRTLSPSLFSRISKETLALSLTDLFSVVESIHASFSILAPLFGGISLESLYAENFVSRVMDMNDREILFLTILLRSNEYVDESWMKTFDVIDVIINEFSIKRNSGRSGVVNAKSCL